MGKQPKEECHIQSNKAPEHSSSRKNKTKHPDQSQKAQNAVNPSTLQDWHDCKAETSARMELARVIHWQHALVGATVTLKSAPTEFIKEKKKSNPRNRPVMVKLKPKAKLTKRASRKSWSSKKSQGWTKKTRQYSKCSIHKLDRRLTEAAFIYFR